MIRKYITNEAKGLYGEWSVDHGISAAQKMGYTGRTLHNAYVPKAQGMHTEIDVLYITRKGVFVFESKNHLGWFFGDGESTYWTLTTPSGNKFKIYNPILQNKGHIQHLSKYIAQKVPFFSVIAYSEQCQIKKISKIPNNTYMVHYSDIPLVIQHVWTSHPDVMSNNQVVELFNTLVELRTRDLDVINAHAQSVCHSYNNALADSTDICPLCGGNLIVRTAKRGYNAGHQFLGCQNYPNCRYSKKL